MQMDITINEDILKQTTKCQHDFACLNSDSYPVCGVLNQQSPSFLETSCIEEEPCPYCVPYTSTKGFCACPTRGELYRRYGI
jgi:hypothetical protein